MIKNVITKGRVPIKMWLDNCEHGAIEQAINLSNLPFVHKHVALMPDAHQGYGMPIGGVIACDSMVIPNAVGVDIGCGVSAIKTDMRSVKRMDILRLYSEIQQDIPVGFKHHSIAKGMPYSLHHYREGGVVESEFDKAKKQLGTLGGGNHFIEIQQDEQGYFWIMIHSGSRNVGLQIAKHYNNVAKALNQKWSVSTPPSHQLAFLPIDSTEGQAYLEEMSWAVEFAKCNRAHMLEVVCDLFLIYFGCQFQPPIDIAHNYAAIEEHYHKRVVVHRKGATSAKLGEIGIIPGGQGSSSYIVRGKGNPLSFQSCSHGAGRVMSRSKAKAELNLEQEQKYMDRQEIVHNLRHANQLDEATSAYKNINEVMENQSDLVEIVHKLTPRVVIKG